MAILVSAALVATCGTLCICVAAIVVAHMALRGAPSNDRARILTSLACLIRAIRGRS